MIAHAVVVIPARDEADRIERCLRSVVAAATHCPLAVTIVVAADSCRDSTPRLAREFPGVCVLEIDETNVGAARRAGVETALAGLSTPREEIWLACTDADSVVPENWLTSQIAHADAGADLVIGTVRPDPAEYPEERQREWLLTHIPGRPNGHVHGANLGVRVSAYCAVGGFRAIPEHEDVDLVARLAHVSTVASDAGEVLTSARLEGRTPGGYAGYLRALFTPE